MPIWDKVLQEHIHNYVRQGGKENRKKQVSLIINFFEYTDSVKRIASPHQIGKNHVIAFWKSHRHLSDKAANDYWLGLCKLWEWLNKHGKPPKPNNFNDQNNKLFTKPYIPTEAKCTEVSVAIKSTRESRNLNIRQLSNMTGIEITLIESVENGQTDILFSDIINLLNALNINTLYQQKSTEKQLNNELLLIDLESIR